MVNLTGGQGDRLAGSIAGLDRAHPVRFLTFTEPTWTEAQRPDYGFLSNTHRQRATIAKPGTMFVSQPEIPVPLVVEFPFPAWATRPSERGGLPPNLDGSVAKGALPDDPFEGVAASPGT